MRWYGPDIALTYDWLYDAPGVDAGAARADAHLPRQPGSITTRSHGYHHDEAGANYNAGYIIGKTLGAIAIGNDGGADGHLWTRDARRRSSASCSSARGSPARTSGVGTPAGVMVGGDWGEGWQYGPLSVLEYAAAARALEDNGASLPEMDAWANSLALRYIHGDAADDRRDNTAATATSTSRRRHQDAER